MTPTKQKPQPKLNQKCHDCPHIWGDHIVSKVGSDPRFSTTRVRCPECDCVHPVETALR